MKTIKFLTLITLFIGFTSCDSDDAPLLDVESDKVINLHAPQTSDYTTNPPTISGDYTKFSFANGSTTTGDNWDIAFRGTTILVNGGEKKLNDEPTRTGQSGAYIVLSALANVTDVDTSLFIQDTTTDLAISGWYDYNPTTHIITALAGKILVIKTHDGKYAKVEILSYYKDSDTAGDSQYYTFNYVYQPNEGVTTF